MALETSEQVSNSLKYPFVTGRIRQNLSRPRKNSLLITFIISTITTLSTLLPSTSMPSLLASPHRLCSHLQTVSRGALARTSIPYTEASLAITSILLRHGLISTLTLGSPTDPTPSIFPSLGVADRRIWVGLKYRNGLPVLRNMSVVSKGSLRVHADHGELGRILTGRRARNVAGVSMGEIFVVRTPPDADRGRTGRETYMDGWEAWRAGLGGELVVRAS